MVNTIPKIRQPCSDFNYRYIFAVVESGIYLISASIMILFSHCLFQVTYPNIKPNLRTKLQRLDRKPLQLKMNQKRKRIMPMQYKKMKWS